MSAQRAVPLNDPPQDGSKHAAESTLAVIRKFGESRRSTNDESDRIANARRILLKAFEKQFLSNSEAVKAINSLRQGELTLPPLDLSGNETRDLKFVPGSTTPVFDAVPSIEIRTPPHFDVWVWGNQGRHEKDKTTGQIGIWGSDGDFSQAGVPSQDDDHLEGATGTLDLVTTTQKALVTVTAEVWNSWGYGVQAHGVGSSAAVSGGIDMAAFHDGNAVDGPRRLELFSDSASTFNLVTHYGTGVATPSVNFTLFPGDTVGVPFGVWLVCDHSDWVGTAGAAGAIIATVRKLTIFKLLI